MEHLLKEIESTKNKLHLYISSETTLTSESIIKKSQLLDELIKKFYEYHRMI